MLNDKPSEGYKQLMEVIEESAGLLPRHNMAKELIFVKGAISFYDIKPAVMLATDEDFCQIYFINKYCTNKQ